MWISQSTNGCDDRGRRERSSIEKTAGRRLGASRPRALRFRLRFVFSVCHLVSRWCHNILILSNCPSAALRSGHAALPHPAPKFHLTSNGQRTIVSARGQPLQWSVLDALWTRMTGIPVAKVKLLSGRVSTPSPSLSTGRARASQRETMDTFPTPALPGFSPADWSSAGFGTMRPSDSLKIICLPRFLGSSGILDGA